MEIVIVKFTSLIAAPQFVISLFVVTVFKSREMPQGSSAVRPTNGL